MDFHKIITTTDSGFPQFRFEFHPATKKVYVLGLTGGFSGKKFELSGSEKVKAFVLAEDCDHNARFLAFVQAYLRGYRQGRYDQIQIVKSSRRAEVQPEGETC